MATKLTNEGEGSFEIETNHNGWKFPKIPVDQVYDKNNDVLGSSEVFKGPSFWSKDKNMFNIFPSYPLKEFEKTITLKVNN